MANARLCNPPSSQLETIVPHAFALAFLGQFALGLAVVLAPVVIRNYAVDGGFYLTTSQFGSNFYIGNNPQADGTYASIRFGRGAPEYERIDATEVAEASVGRTLSPSEVELFASSVTYSTRRPSISSGSDQSIRLISISHARLNGIDTGDATGGAAIP